MKISEIFLGSWMGISLLGSLGAQSSADELKNANLKSPSKVTNSKATNEITSKPLDNAVTTEEIGEEAGVPVKYKITTQKVTASASYSQSNLLDPDSQVIYLGSVLRGDSIDDGSYREITAGVKNPVKISYSLSGIKNGMVSSSIVPSLTTTRELHNKITSQKIPEQPSLRFQYEYLEVSNSETLDLMINAGASYTGAIKAQVKAGFNFSSEKKVNRYLIKFSQTFYTSDVDQEGDNFLYKNYQLKSFGGYRPVYVSSIAYGRVGFLSVETTMSKEALKANLEATITTALAKGNLATSVSKSKLTENTSIGITLIGGLTAPTTLDGFLNEVQTGGFSPKNMGVRIAYTLRFVDDNSIANVMFTGDYVSRKVIAYKGLYTISLKVSGFRASHKDAGNDLELFGDILFKRDTGTNSPAKSLWSYSYKNYHQFKHNQKVGFNGQVQTFDQYTSPTDQIVIKLENMGETDTGADDKIDRLEKAIMIKDLQSGVEFPVKTDFSIKSKGWLEVYFTPTVTFTFNTKSE